MSYRHDTAGESLSSTLGVEILVRDVMTRDVISVLKYDNVRKVANILSERNFSGLPVRDKENNLIGIITQADILSIIGIRKTHTFKDLLRHILGEPVAERKMGDMVGDLMASPAVAIKPDATIAEAAQIMEEKRIRRLPVTDDSNKLTGIISRADILKAVIRKLKWDNKD
jgi:CBS domain-containing protein